MYNKIIKMPAGCGMSMILAIALTKQVLDKKTLIKRIDCLHNRI